MDIRSLNKIFQNTRVKVTYSINNTVKSNSKVSKKNDKYHNSTAYQLKCLSCKQVYTEQMGRDFRTRYKEHVRDVRYNHDKSYYTQHIFDCNHKYGPADNIMGILKILKKKKAKT
jgi:hypothetical protein